MIISTSVLSPESLPKHLQIRANIVARKNGYQRATKVVLTNKDYNGDISNVEQAGYRKITTGEYVSNAYRNKFGWKNTYYNELVCVVRIPANEKTVEKYLTQN